VRCAVCRLVLVEAEAEWMRFFLVVTLFFLAMSWAQDDPTQLPDGLTREEVLRRLAEEAARLQPEGAEARLAALEKRSASRSSALKACAAELSRFRFPELKRLLCLNNFTLTDAASVAEYASVAQTVERIAEKLSAKRIPVPVRVMLAASLEANAKREIAFLERDYRGEPAADELVNVRRAQLDANGLASLGEELVVSLPWHNETAGALAERKAQLAQFFADAEMVATAAAPDTLDRIVDLAFRAFDNSRVGPAAESCKHGAILRIEALSEQISNCGASRRCRDNVTHNLLDATFQFSSCAVTSEREQLWRNHSALLRGCWVNCATEHAVVWEASTRLAFERLSVMMTALLAAALYCRTDGASCRDPGQLQTAVETFGKSVMLGSAAYTYRFAEPAVAVAGIVVFSVILGALIALVIVGLVWKTLFGRLVWILLLAGITGACVARLYVWGYAYAPTVGDADDMAISEFAIAAVVGHFVKLIVVVMLLLLVYLLLPHTAVAVALCVLSGVLAAGAIANVAVVFTNNTILKQVREWQEDLLSYWTLSGTTFPDYVIVLPNVVLSGVALLAAVTLCVLFGRSLQSARDNALTRAAVHRAFAFSTALGAAVAVMFAVSVAQINRFGVWSPALFLGVGIIGVEGVIFSAFLAMVFNSWWTSQQMDSNTKGLIEKPLLDSSASSDVPLRYME
jgi:hypothetical protein